MTDAELTQPWLEVRQAADQLRKFYASGVSFFTKASLADLASQLEHANKSFREGDSSEGGGHGDTFVLRRLDGKAVEIKYKKRTPCKMPGSNKAVMLVPILRYCTCQRLIADNKHPDHFSREGVHCPLQVTHCFRECDTITNQFVPSRATRPLEATKKGFDTGVKAWQDSEECRKLTSALMEHTTPDKMTKLVAFACGTMLDSDIDPDQRSISQHALILTVKSILQTKNAPADAEIKCYAQDPKYSDADRTAIEEAGIQVLEDPHGFLEVDDSSVVLSFSPHVPVRQIVADLARPAIMIWNKIRSDEGAIRLWSGTVPEETWCRLEEMEGIVCDPESSRLREMAQNEYDLIEDFDDTMFGQASVYVRRSSAT